MREIFLTGIPKNSWIRNEVLVPKDISDASNRAPRNARLLLL